MLPSRASSSPAVAGRWSGSLARHCITTSEISRGASTLSCQSTRGVSLMCADTSPCAVTRSANGCAPLRDLVGDDAPGVEISAMVGRSVPQRLLWRHVRGCADRRPDGCVRAPRSMRLPGPMARGKRACGYLRRRTSESASVGTSACDFLIRGSTVPPLPRRKLATSAQLLATWRLTRPVPGLVRSSCAWTCPTSSDPGECPKRGRLLTPFEPETVK
jgi:hypothetical protein